MVQSSTADALKKVLQGVSAHIQANDADELEYNEIAREVTRKKWRFKLHFHGGRNSNYQRSYMNIVSIKIFVQL